MRKDQCFKLGKVTKTKGFKGDLVIFIEKGSPKDYKKLESVFVEINNKLVPFFIDTYRTTSRNNVSIHLENIDENTAEQLVGASLYLPIELQPQPSSVLEKMEQIIGFTIRDKEWGDLGQVDAFYDISGNPLLAFQYEEKEVLLPLNMVEINTETREIYTDLPEGFLEL